MPKFQLIIASDEPREIMNLLASMFVGTTIAGNNIVASNLSSNDIHSDDESGPANTNAPAVDSAGIPWDERIHSKNKGLNADGTWRKKRGVTANDVTNVENELKVKTAANAGMYMQQPQAGQQQFQQPALQMHQPQQPQMQMHQPQHPQQFQQPQQYPVMQPNTQMGQPGNMILPPQQQPGAQQLDFNGFMTHLTFQMAKFNGTATPIDVNYLAGVCQRLSAHFGRAFNSITDIGSDPNVINAAVTFIANDGRWY